MVVFVEMVDYVLDAHVNSAYLTAGGGIGGLVSIFQSVI
jgi:hypothetical protein